MINARVASKLKPFSESETFEAVCFAVRGRVVGAR